MAEADRLAERWFAAQEEAATLDARIEELEVDLENLQTTTVASRDTAHRLAVSLYQRDIPVPVGELFGGTDAMDTARRAVILGQVNESARDELQIYTISVRDARARLKEIERQRVEHAAVLAQLDRDQVAMKKQLAAAQRAYRAELAALADATTTTAAPSESSDDAPATVDPPPPPQPGEYEHRNDPFLSCVRQRESHGIYTAVNPAGYYGAYQFGSSTWDVTASHAGRPELIGVRPDTASVWDQDELAWVLYQWQGMGPWGGGCG